MGGSDTLSMARAVVNGTSNDPGAAPVRDVVSVADRGSSAMRFRAADATPPGVDRHQVQT